MIDVFVDVLGKLAADGIYNKAIDPAIAFSTFYAILTDQQLVGNILSLYFHKHLQDPTKTAIFCLCEELFGEKIATSLVKSWPIASSKVADLAERLHARICVSNTSTLNTNTRPNVRQGSPLWRANESPTLSHLKRQLDELLQHCNSAKGTAQQVSFQSILPVIKDMAGTIVRLSAEWHELSTETQHTEQGQDVLVEKDAQIRDLKQRICELETGLSDMCAKIEVYMGQMEAYSHEMAVKNEQILILHQQLKEVRTESSDRELNALKELLNEKDCLITSIRADLTESTTTADRLAHECIHLNQRSEELSFYKSLVVNTIDVLKALSAKDAELSYSPPADDTYLRLPEYVAFVIDIIRTKAHWLATEEPGQNLPLPSQDTSPLLRSVRAGSVAPSVIESAAETTNPSLVPDSNHPNSPYCYRSAGNPSTSILGRLAMIGRDKGDIRSHLQGAQ
ncbi:Hypothetical protein GLP15_4316 [Giardia lamblia P15]|uniref:Uncharacterized protein n=1 Tax=Giardia intestinalis (strain P15) TaxID=658858 RepID=E1EWV4_GIAIA|nr:Hypothetical protein GLP15_4316 [Giardia lamblia P15]